MNNKGYELNESCINHKNKIGKMSDTMIKKGRGNGNTTYPTPRRLK